MMALAANTRPTCSLLAHQNTTLKVDLRRDVVLGCAAVWSGAVTVVGLGWLKDKTRKQYKELILFQIMIYICPEDVYTSSLWFEPFFLKNKEPMGLVGKVGKVGGGGAGGDGGDGGGGEGGDGDGLQFCDALVARCTCCIAGLSQVLRKHF